MHKSKGTITKEKIARMLTEETGIPFSVCEDLVDCIFHKANELIKNGEKLVLHNFGSFRMKQKVARPGRNLKTGETIVISPRKVIRFIPSVHLKSSANS
jgi:integration host factor subunit alpha